MTATTTGSAVVARTRAELEAALGGGASARAGTVGLVPTMGALHDGHASLMATARPLADRLVVSIFVNPLQFGPTEDLSRYPRTPTEDLAMCAAEGVDVVFLPELAEVYPGGDPQVTVDPGPLATVLEGRSRPGHFHGVLTVVAKLFGLVRPDVAVFGQKDYQQLALIRRMAADLCLGVEVVGADTVREPDGLAMSSRNRYLDPEQRGHAVTLSAALYAAQQAAYRGPEAALHAAREVLRRSVGVDLDYLELTDPGLGPAPDEGEGRILIAARVGSTRLIDNMALRLGRKPAVSQPTPRPESGPSSRRSDLDSTAASTAPGGDT